MKIHFYIFKCVQIVFGAAVVFFFLMASADIEQAGLQIFSLF